MLTRRAHELRAARERDSLARASGGPRGCDAAPPCSMTDCWSRVSRSRVPSRPGDGRLAFGHSIVIPRPRLAAAARARRRPMARSLARSNAHFRRALRRMPLGVSSNFRYWGDERTLYVRRGRGARIWDLDGNEYIDYRL